MLYINLTKHIFLLFLILLLDPLPAFSQTLDWRSDVIALYNLRSSLGLRGRDWPVKTNPCTVWTGVTCRSGRVVGLNLSGLRRTRLGRLNPKFAVEPIQNLTRLETFNSTGFSLPGSIPDWFGQLFISVLVLRGANVNGAIPYSLGNVTSLTVLDLSRNFITGDLPPTLGQLRNLTSLDVSGNSITGTVPDSIGKLGKITFLDLSSNFISGEVPVTFGDLRLLKKLNFSSNSISGSVPESLGKVSGMESLDLSFNSMVGNLPDSFKNLARLQAVRLSNNTFSGKVPDSLWFLKDLVFLDLSNNNFTGVLPDMKRAYNGSGNDRGLLDLSNNIYYGEIPTGFLQFAISKFAAVDFSENFFEGDIPDNANKNVSFELNCFKNGLKRRSLVDCQQFYVLRGLPYDGPSSPSPPSNPSHKNNSLKWILIGVLCGFVVLVLVIVAIVLCICQCRGKTHDGEQRETHVPPPVESASEQPVSRIPTSGVSPAPSGAKLNLSLVGAAITFEQLVRATNEFSDKNFIKHGHSGDLYHGLLEDGNAVVVKRINLETIKKPGYAVELDFFSKVSHSRFVPFLGHFLDSENEKFLVYKFMPHGDLSNALYIKSGQDEEGLDSLDWITRLKIATGIAEALSYLHHECMPPLVHRDVQASSILLDDKFEVRLGSLSEVCAQESEAHQNVITRFLRLSSQTSEQSASGSATATCAYDVYCLGKVLLELVTGKLDISGINDTSTTEFIERTLQYINIYDKDLVTKIVDPSLIVDEDLLEEVWAMAVIAKSCLNPKPSKRPLVRYVLKALENPLKVVREENTGSARLRAGSSRGSWNAAFFGSWRQSSLDVASASGTGGGGGGGKEERGLRRTGTMRSQGSGGGEHSFSYRRSSKEIFPEPSGSRDVEE